MDQYASKVIEKCLKIGGNEFLDRYLERVCEGRHDRPRMPLIDSKTNEDRPRIVANMLTIEQLPVISLAITLFNMS
jgi:hypothetical protein